MNDPAVRTVDLTHRYGDRVALDRFTFEVRAGERFALLGPNGGGKTTLFRILTTLMAPSSGSAGVFGADVVRDRAAVRRMIGVAFQSPSLDDKLTVAENLRHGGHLYGMQGVTLRARIDVLLEQFGIHDRARERVDKLSGGLARRVELAKAMLHRPRLLLLDEPTAGLDVAARRDLWAAVRRLQENDEITVLLTTHVLDDADLATRVAVIDHGKRIAVDTPAALKRLVGGECVALESDRPDAMAQDIRKRFSVDARVVDHSVRIEHEDAYRFVAELAAAFGERVNSVTVSRPTLADAFLHLTGHRLDDDSAAPKGAAA